jgi:hypothetical protein
MNISKKELQVMGLYGNGRTDTRVSVKDFEYLLKTKLINGQKNEYGTVDYTVSLTDEEGNDFIFTVEVDKGFVTHSYY